MRIFDKPYLDNGWRCPNRIPNYECERPGEDESPTIEDELTIAEKENRARSKGEYSY